MIQDGKRLYYIWLHKMWEFLNQLFDRQLFKQDCIVLFLAINLEFLDRSRHFPIQVAPHLSSRVWVDLVPHP
jgi:hypothetical protein